MLSDGTERPATDSEVSRVRRGVAGTPPQGPGAASGDPAQGGAAAVAQYDQPPEQVRPPLPGCRPAPRKKKYFNKTACCKPAADVTDEVAMRPGAHPTGCDSGLQAAGGGAAPGLAGRGAGAAAAALARLPEAAALKFLRQMRPGAADAALAGLQARSLCQ